MEEQTTPLPFQWREGLAAFAFGLVATLAFGLSNVQLTDNLQAAQTYGGTLTTLLVCAGLWVSFKGKKQATPWFIFLTFAIPGPLSLTLPLPIQTRIVYHLLGLAGIAMILSIQYRRQSPRA